MPDFVNRAIWLVPILLVHLIAMVAHAGAISGKPRVIDADTLAFADGIVRLAHIDAPELAQTCPGGPAEMARCGDYAADRLRSFVGTAEVSCSFETTDDYGRFIAECLSNGQDVSTWLVASGLAMAFVRYSDAMIGEQEKARRSGFGLWQTNFEPPWAFRAQRWQSAEQAAPDGCPIKGNINRNGERIYHTPWGSPHYGRTRINTAKGERWFCDENDAVLAGWRAPLR